MLQYCEEERVKIEGCCHLQNIPLISMKWVQISIETSRESEDALSNLLVEMGSGGVQIEDDDPASDEIVITTYFPSDDAIGERVSRITGFLRNMKKLGVNVGAGWVSLKSLDERNWSERCREFFKPIPVGERIVVSPSWADVSEFPQRDVLIQIDPGRAFGTGKHPSTTLSLELLEKVIKSGERAADVGTGSGILAIAAAKLGASKVVAIDVDTTAASVARENFYLNGVDDRVHIICGNSLNVVSGKYDVIVSNISSKVLLMMIPDFASHLNADGRLILSGILESEVSEIRNGLEGNNLIMLDTRLDKEWAAILAEPEDVLP